jgi:hypothetical protein
MSYLKFRDHSTSLKLSVTYLGLSPFKEYVLVGMSNGEVYLYDTTSSPASNIISILHFKLLLPLFLHQRSSQLLTSNTGWTISGNWL